MISGMPLHYLLFLAPGLSADCHFRLLDKIAKDIMVCENKTIRRWDGTIGKYKNYLRKKMVTMGQV